MFSRNGFFLGLAAVAFFCAPLFVNLGGLDYRSDEAIYAYAVDRILDTGEWLTPRSIGVDGPFLEKPPLKFWMSAALLRAGLLPHNEAGLRFLDALFGAIGFLYIYSISLRLAGPIAGVVAVFVLFMLERLVYEHGLRSYNMEAALFLCYCGGVYHFMRWVEAGPRSPIHAVMVAAWFVLGFATKFVAALFLPAIFVVTALAAEEPRRRLLNAWRDWIAPVLLAVAVIVPWFLYESRLHGELFWNSIVGEHVLRRFTDALDPGHVKPWHFYLTETWLEFSRIDARLVAIVGIAGLVVGSWWVRTWQMRLLLVWLVVPFTFISLGTSKLFHYAYPFLPPLGLAVGWAAQTLINTRLSSIRQIRSQFDHVANRFPAIVARAPVTRATLVIGAVLAIGLAAATALNERIVWNVGGVRVFQNSSVLRPLGIAAVLLAYAGRGALAYRLMLAMVMTVVLPVSQYSAQVIRAYSNDRQLRAIRRCVIEVQESHSAQAGVYNAARGFPNHSFYYYLRHLGSWTEPENPPRDEIHARLTTDSQQLVLMTPEHYRDLDLQAPSSVLVHGLVIVFPGRYAPCAARALVAGATLPTDSPPRW